MMFSLEDEKFYAKRRAAISSVLVGSALLAIMFILGAMVFGR